MSRVYKVQGSAVCEVCGNAGCQCFEVRIGGERHIFDCFECALDVLSPQCHYCGTPFVGQGVPVGNKAYCSYDCVHAARAERRKIPLDRYENIIFQDSPALI